MKDRAMFWLVRLTTSGVCFMCAAFIGGALLGARQNIFVAWATKNLGDWLFWPIVLAAIAWMAVLAAIAMTVPFVPWHADGEVPPDSY
jgi:hypothetical protein